MHLTALAGGALESRRCGPLVTGAEKAEAMGSFGENLRRERELRGVSLREIAEGTKISLRFLQALEEDRVDVLPGGLFPRAFVKQYAVFLGLDVDKAVADFVASHAEAPPERKVYSEPSAAVARVARAGLPRGRGGPGHRPHVPARGRERARPARADAHPGGGGARGASHRPGLPLALARAHRGTPPGTASC